MQVVGDDLARVFLGIQAVAKPPGVVQVRMSGLDCPLALRIIRACPALAPVMQVAQRVEVLLPAGRKRVERLACGQFHPRCDEVQFMVPGVAVAHPEDVIAIRLQPGESRALKVVHEPLFLLRRHGVLRPPRQGACRKLPGALLGVDEVARHVRVAPQDHGGCFCAAWVVQAQQIVHRPPARAFAVREELQVHGPRSFSSRSTASSRMMTCTAPISRV